MNVKKDENVILVYLFLTLIAFTLIAMIVMSVAFARGGLNSASGDEEDHGTSDEVTSGDVDKSPVSKPVSPVILNQTSDMGEDYLKKIVFVGDSTTYHLIARGVLPDGTNTKQVWGPTNGTLMLGPSVTSLKIVYPETGEQLTIAEAAALKKPEYMVLTIGLNGSHSFTETVYKGSYRKLIDAIREASPNTKIILQSVFPVAANESAWTSVTPAELNLCIDQVNLWAKDLTTEYDNVRYLDTQSVLRDDENFLKSAYEFGDGIHLTAEGYRAILQYIRTHAWIS